MRYAIRSRLTENGFLATGDYDKRRGVRVGASPPESSGYGGGDGRSGGIQAPARRCGPKHAAKWDYITPWTIDTTRTVSYRFKTSEEEGRNV